MNEIHFTISEKNARLLNEVRATVSGNVKMTPQQHLKIDPLG